MPEEKRPLKVFLSYASQDKPVVRELSRRLVGEGWIDTWLDEKKLLPGQDWRLVIEEAVETSDIVIICLSSNSVNKEGYVQKELRYAREIALEKPEETIFLVPLRLDECDVPRGLRFYQWVDYFGEKRDESYSTLIESLKLRYEQRLMFEELERVRKEKLEREVAKEIVKEKVARDNGEKKVVEKAWLVADELARQKAAHEKHEHNAAEKVAREKAEREANEKAARKATLTTTLLGLFATLKSTHAKSKPILRAVGIIGIIIILFWVGSFGISKFIALLPTATIIVTTPFTQISTATSTAVTPSETPKPSLTPTKTYTSTSTITPTITATVTNTPIPPCPGGDVSGSWSGTASDDGKVSSYSMSLYQIGCQVSGSSFTSGSGGAHVTGSVLNGIFSFSESGSPGWCYYSGSLKINGNRMTGKDNKCGAQIILTR